MLGHIQTSCLPYIIYLSLFQNMLDGSNIPHVERANPEEFIHLFLNNSERLVEFLEHLVKVLDFSSSFIKQEMQNA